MIITLNSTTKYEVDLTGWHRLSSGQEHLVLEHSDYDHVWIVPIKHNEPQLSSLNAVYQYVLSTTELQPYLSQSHCYSLSENSQEKLKIYLENEVPEIHVEFPVENVFQSENLLKLQQWDCTLEIKVKSPLPSLPYNCNSEPLFHKLEPKQRTRWWSKSIHSGIFKHLNPLSLFTLDKSIDFTTFIYDKSQLEIENINTLILEKLESSKLLLHILQLQRLSSGTPELLLEAASDLMQRPLSIEEQHNMMESIVQTLSLNESDEIIKIIDEAHRENTFNRQWESPRLEVLKFLIGLTWQDVSLVIRIKGKTVDLKIIDYRLKKIKKVGSDAQKRQKLQKKMIEWIKNKKNSSEINDV